MIPVHGSIQQSVFSWFSSLSKPFYERSKLTLAIGCACAVMVCAYGIYKYYYDTPVNKQGGQPKTNRENKNNKKFEPRPTGPVADTTPHGQLLKAATQGDVALMKSILREHGSNAVLNKQGILLLNAMDVHTGQTLLHKAAMSGKLAACKFLLQFNKTFDRHGVGLNTKDKDGNTPLHCAVSSMNKQCEDIVTLFIQHGADILAQNNDGNTALHVAVEWSEYKSITQLLISCTHLHEFLALKNKNHRTAQQLAYRQTDKEIILALFAPFIQSK